MSNPNALAPRFSGSIQDLAASVAKSGLFGCKTTEQAVALMCLAESQGLHPMVACTRYHIIDGRPSMKAEAMLAAFVADGGKFSIIHYGDDYVEMAFSCNGNEIKIRWDQERYMRAIGATNVAALANRVVAKYPAAIFRSRCISEAIRTIAPHISCGMYSEHEVQDMPSEPKQVQGRDIPEFEAIQANATPPLPAPTLGDLMAALGRLSQIVGEPDYKITFKKITGLDTLRGIDEDQRFVALNALNDAIKRLEMETEPEPEPEPKKEDDSNVASN
tara:strand:+ start:165 stop:989 length:825 start_codon:yes stop_codon:yes gene_type:complete